MPHGTATRVFICSGAGLSKAVLFLKPLVAKHAPVTWADAIQLAGTLLFLFPLGAK